MIMFRAVYKYKANKRAFAGMLGKPLQLCNICTPPQLNRDTCKMHVCIFVLGWSAKYSYLAHTFGLLNFETDRDPQTQTHCIEPSKQFIWRLPTKNPNQPQTPQANNTKEGAGR